jgi:AcrR family transcriptional regulator
MTQGGAQRKETDGPRACILAAAYARFQRFGFSKTTMAEIAGDCGMSAANLYRYFKNKEDIGVHTARCRLQETEAVARRVVERPGLSAREKLEAFILEVHHWIAKRIENETFVQDLAAYILMKRRDLVYAHCDRLAALMAEILRQGNESGEFEVADPLAVAKTILDAYQLFYHPLLIAQQMEREFDTEAHRVVELLVRGLAPRQPQRSRKSPRKRTT